MIEKFHSVGDSCSSIVTKQYSSSFSSAIRLLHKPMRQPVYNIYGFVRLADEIVDSFHQQNKKQLLEEFKRETGLAIERRLSLNPVLHSFQRTVHQFNIDRALIDAFFKSMESDLTQQQYDQQGYNDYIYGSAEAVGLMCLYIFCKGDKLKFAALEAPAKALGAAFQKVNFLRDVKADFEGLQRIYFPDCDFNRFTETDKLKIEKDIAADFAFAYKGILELPVQCRFGVYVAYKYYLSLFKKIRKVQPSQILEKRIRIPGHLKALILVRAGVRNKLNIL
jgi:phytoene/squalene synthetase